MKYRKATLLIAIVLGLIVASMITGYVNNVKIEVSGKTQLVNVLVATDELQAGISLDELRSRGLITAKSIPREFVVSNALLADDDVGDRVLAFTVDKNEQLSINKFKVPKEAGLSLATPSNKIAVAIPTSEMRAVGNLIKIGDYVNVIGTLKDANKQQITKTLLNRVQVLALGSSLEDKSSGSSSNSGITGGKKEQTVTLALSQAEAEKLVFVLEQEDQGQIWLTLVPPAQGEAIPTPGQTLTTILK